MKKVELMRLIKTYEDYLLEIRRKIHQNPGVRFSKEEDATILMIQEEIYKFINNGDPFTIHEYADFGGYYIDIKFNPKFKWLLFRADIDALAVEEETGLTFSSTTPGVSHACGHDTHVAMLLTAMRIMVENPGLPKYNIRFVFQRAEENPIDGKSGGKMLVETGVCNGMSEAHALHIWTGDPKNNVFLSRPGKFMANSGRLKISVTTSGGHVAKPSYGINAIRVGMAIIDEIDLIAQEFSPSDNLSLEPTIFQAGKETNVIPQQAELWTGLRNHMSSDELKNLCEHLNSSLQDVAKRHNAQVIVEPIQGHPALFNNEAVYQKTAKILQRAGEKTDLAEIQQGGEDFSRYLAEVPGDMWLLGAWQENSGNHHSPKFNPDESVMVKGALFWLLLASKKH